MLEMMSERCKDFNANNFVNELFEAARLLGVLETKITSYDFKSFVIPLLQTKEAISSMQIEGTQTTLSNVVESRIIESKKIKDRTILDGISYTNAIVYGIEYLSGSSFTDELIKELHEVMLEGTIKSKKNSCFGHYKSKNNCIVNSVGSVIFEPPPYNETDKYMRDLLDFMNNNNDGLNPLIKAALMHAQFESIHPFEDGNGRVGRMLISLFLYKAKVINFPFFYISEAINKDKAVYYNKLTSSRQGSYDQWIKFFLQKCIVQASSQIEYVDTLLILHERIKNQVREIINSPKFDKIIECMFIQPVLTPEYLAQKLSVTTGQAKRYLNKLEKYQVLHGDDKIRNRKYYFVELIDLVTRI
jgi:Fic family protein